MCRKYCMSLRLMLTPLTAPCAGPVWLQQHRYLIWCSTDAEHPKYTPRGSLARRGLSAEGWFLPCLGQEVQSQIVGCPLSITPSWKALAQPCTGSAATANKCLFPACKARTHRENWQAIGENQGGKYLAALVLAQGTPATRIYCMDTKSLHVHGSWHVLQQASPGPVFVA